MFAAALAACLARGRGRSAGASGGGSRSVCGRGDGRGSGRGARVGGCGVVRGVVVFVDRSLPPIRTVTPGVQWSGRNLSSTYE
jgi:hypothetical protein